jgi:hypothetical protein
MNERNLIEKMLLINKLTGLINIQFKSEISKVFALEDINEAVSFYVKNMSAGKVLIKPTLKASQPQEQK